MIINITNKRGIVIAEKRVLNLLMVHFSHHDDDGKVHQLIKESKEKDFCYFDLGLLEMVLKSSVLKRETLVRINDKRSKLPVFQRIVEGINSELKFEGKYEHQLNALKACNNYIQLPKNISYKGVFKSEKGLYFPLGIISVTTGGGKTAIITAILKSMNPNQFFMRNKMIVLINRDLSFNSLYSEFCEYLGEENVGMIKSDLIKIKPITLCMYQTLNNRMSNDAFRERINEEFNTVVVDECHYAGAEDFQNTLSKLDAGAVFGFSGTPFSENHDKVRRFKTIGKLGEQRFLYTPKEAVLSGVNLKPIIKVYKINHSAFDIEDEKYIDYFKRVVASNSIRNQIIANESKSQYMTLIGFHFKEHGRFLESYLKKHYKRKGIDIRIGYVDGSLSKKKKMKLFEDCNKLKYDILIASSSIKDAVNIKCISQIVMTHITGSDVWFKQLIGRALRPYKDLKTIKYIDFFDNGAKETFVNHFKARQRYFDDVYADVYTFDSKKMMEGDYKPIFFKKAGSKKYKLYK